MPDPQHNVTKMTREFDSPHKTIVYSVWMRNNPGVAVIEHRADVAGLCDFGSEVLVTVRQLQPDCVKITMSGPAVARVYESLPRLGAPKTVAEAYARIRAHNRTAQDKIAVSTRDLDAYVFNLCRT
jgi:hypothetical protein